MKQKEKTFTIPVFDLATLAGGFYAGYHEGKGIPMSIPEEYFSKAGTTIFTAAYSPMMREFYKFRSKRRYDRAANRFRSALGFPKRYGRLLDDEEKMFLNDGQKEYFDRLEERLNYRPDHIQGLKRTGIIALEAAIGYGIGRAYSMLT